MSSSDEEMEEDCEVVYFKTISEAKLNNLFAKEGRLKNSLILDTRDNQKFKEEHVRNSYNIPNVEYYGNERFSTKADVMEYLLNKLSCHIVQINVPGHYDKIILYDENSSEGIVSDWLITIVDLLIKWNEDMKTHVWVLNSGFESVKTRFPHLVTSTIDGGLLKPPESFPPIIEKFPESPSISPGAGKSLEYFHLYMKSLNKAIKKAVEKIDLQRKLVVLEKVKVLLEEEEIKELNKTIDDFAKNSIKCRPCNQKFTVIICKCNRGHGISRNCLKHHVVCPPGKDRLPFRYGSRELPESCPHGVKLTSLTHQRLMATALSVKCSHDNDTIQSLNQASSHMSDCLRCRGTIITRVEVNIQLVKIHNKVLTKELKVVKKKVLQNETEWLEVAKNDETEGVTRGFAEKLYTKKIIFNQVQMTLELEAVMKNGAGIMET